MTTATTTLFQFDICGVLLGDAGGGVSMIRLRYGNNGGRQGHHGGG